MRLLAVELGHAQEQVGGARESARLNEARDELEAVHDAEPYRRHRHPQRGRRDAKIAVEGELDGCPVAVPLQAGDDRGGALPERVGSGPDDTVGVEVGRRAGQSGEVVAGRERIAAGASEDYRPGPLAVVLQRARERPEELGVERVAALRPVQREGQDVVGSPLAEKRVSQVWPGMCSSSGPARVASRPGSGGRRP